MGVKQISHNTDRKRKPWLGIEPGTSRTRSQHSKLTSLESYMTCSKIDSHFLKGLVPSSFYICLNICLDQLLCYLPYIYTALVIFNLFYVASFNIMLFNCFPLFHIYICSDYVLNIQVYACIVQRHWIVCIEIGVLSNKHVYVWRLDSEIRKPEHDNQTYVSHNAFINNW